MRLVFQKGNGRSDLREILQGVAADLPRLKLCTKPDEVIWNHTQINPTPVRFAAYAFTSPLDQPADLYWLYSCKESPLNWYIVPAEGTMQGFTGYDRLTHPHYRDLSVPVHDHVFCQSLTGGHILPGKDYILWFAQRQSQDETRLASLIEWQKSQGDTLSEAQRAAVEEMKKQAGNKLQEAAPLSIALRLVPTASSAPRSHARGIVEQIGPIFAESPNGTIVCERDEPVRAMSLTPDGRQVVVLDGTNVIRFWDRESRTISREIVGAANYSLAAVSPDGKRLAARSSQSMRVSVWDLESGERLPNLHIDWTEKVRTELAAVAGGYEESVDALSFDDGSDRLLIQTHASGSRGMPFWHDVVLWDVPANNEIHRVSLASVTSDGELFNGGRQLLVTRRGAADQNGQSAVEIALLDWETGATSSAIPLGQGMIWGRLRLSPDETMVAVCITRNGVNAFEVHDVKQRTLVTSLATIVSGETSGSSTVQVAAWSPDSRFLALGFADASVRLWDVKESRLRGIFRGHIKPLRSLAFTPDEKFVISASEDGSVRQWALETPVRDSITDSQGIDLVPISAGEFVMGTIAGYKDPWGYQRTNYASEQPQHRVRISRPFYMGKYEVTVGQFRKFVDATGYKTTAEKSGGGAHMSPGDPGPVQKAEYNWRSPGFPQTDDHPVVQVSWDDAQAFCRWLGDREHAVYRLPTEAEWEYACRAGHDRQMWNMRPLKGDLRGEDAYGNVADASIRKLFGRYDVAAAYDDTYVFTAPVGQCNLNDFGLYDMNGNVFEWCADWHDPIYYRISPDTDPPGPRTGTSRVQRGGSFYHHVDCSRCNYRDSGPPEQAQSCMGFRVVREIPDSAP